MINHEHSRSQPSSASSHLVWSTIRGVALLLIALALMTYRADAETSRVGLSGQIVAGCFVSMFGAGSWLVLWLFGEHLVERIRRPAAGFNAWRTLPALSALFVVCGSLHVTQRFFPSVQPFGHAYAGGYLGDLIGGGLLLTFGPFGATIVCGTSLVFAVLRAARVPDGAVASALTRIPRSASRHLRHLARAWHRSGELLQENQSATMALPRSALASSAHGRSSNRLAGQSTALSGRVKRTAPVEPALVVRAKEQAESAVVVEVESAVVAEVESDPEALGADAPESTQTGDSQSRALAPRLPALAGVLSLPRTQLLGSAPPARRVDRAALDATARRLVEKLSALGIEGSIEHIKPGRIVTMFQFKPPASVKIAQIKELGDDLSLALEADDVRVIAPLPGTTRIGIEVPNPQRTDVYLRELLEDERWSNHPGRLPLALGIDTAGAPVYADLAAMPHLLVAGATGAGKSVGLNAMLLSLLFRYGSADLRLILIDPKIVELAPFNGIPHLHQPVVTDMSQATRVLDWVVEEMERRYELLAQVGARNLWSYNAHVEKRRHVSPDAPSSNEEDAAPLEKLPYIVLVIDEVADLMMVAGKSLPNLLMRLAQKSRASGIHVIIATQRPSVKVITGDIKANLPARISYKVAQQEDSKTILGRVGAERLLGCGDSICNLPNEKALKRVHGPFVSDEDVAAVCDHLRAQCAPGTDPAARGVVASEATPKHDCDSSVLGPEDAELYDRAVEHVAAAGRCSATMLQNALGLGWAKASKVVGWLERDGVVGPAPRGKNAAREVYVRPR